MSLRLRRKQKPERGTDARAPGGFGVLGAFDFHVLKIVAKSPAFLGKPIAQRAGLFPTSLACSRVEPDFQRRLFFN